MGAVSFITEPVQRDAVIDAFNVARADARYEYGNGGYTGSVAEKDDILVLDTDQRSGDNARAYAASLIAAGDERIDDKYGPAGALATVDGWIFFGWASS